MRRWSFVTGLTVVLMLLLVVSGFCGWTARTLTADIDRMISTNFETIRAMRNLRQSIVRIDAQYRATTSASEIVQSRGLFDLESAAMLRRLAVAEANVSQAAEQEAVARLGVLVNDYLTLYREYLALGRFEGDRFKALTRLLAQSAADITETSGVIMELSEGIVLERRAAAAIKGERVSAIAIGIAVFSLGIYIWTSIRLTHALFQPLRELRDSIVKVGQRQFDLIVPLKGGEELAQIATTFNQMAGELRTYLAETDQQAVQASRISRAILEALPYPIYIVDADYAVQVMNPRAEALSRALEISGALPGAVRKAIDDAAALGGDLVGDDLHRAVEIAVPGVASGATPTYLPQVFRMAAVPGAKTGWAVLLVDVTKLRQFDLAKTKALSIIGHEVKTPVTSIRLALHLLLEEKIGALTADQRELVQAGRDDCERLLTVLQALLELARFESGRVAMRLTPAAPAALLAQADAMHGDYVRRLGVTVLTEPVPPGLPAVQADAIHVVRVLGNYLTNAAKYGQPKDTVAMRAELRADGFVRLNVRNRAVRPLSEAEQAKIFVRSTAARVSAPKAPASA